MVTVVIPNYNGISHLRDCFVSLRKQTYSDFVTILVDNGSKDGSIEFISRNFPECKIIQLAENLGFSKAVNLGIRFSIENYSPDFIVLLNNDVECEENFLTELIKGFKSRDIGSVACKMMNFYQRNIIDDTGNFVKLNTLPYARGQGEQDNGQYNNEQLIFGACAGAAIYRKEIFDKVGFFDEDFISYFEDVDFSFRLQRYGYKCLYNPRAICFHKRGATSSANTQYCRYLIEKNLVSLRIKNYPLGILLKYSFNYIIFYFHSLYNDLRWFSLKTTLYSFAGNIRGFSEILRSIRKRMKIMENTVVDNKYILEICEEPHT